MWPLAGRAGALRDAEAWLADNNSGVLVIEGPAGIGKTRLLDELTGRARDRGRRVLAATATSCTRAIPLGAFAHLLSDVATLNRLDLLVAAARQLRAGAGAGHGPILLAVDDAHLLDDWSAALVHHTVAGGNVRAALTLRSPGSVSPDAIQALGKTPHARRLPLPPLTKPEIAACLRRALTPRQTGAGDAVIDERTIAMVMDASDGVPLLVREMTQEALRNGDLYCVNGVWRLRKAVLPSSLDEQLENRLSRLDRDVLEAVELVALGEPMELRALETAVGEAALETAEREGLIEVVESERRHSLRMTHPLLGEAIRSRMPALAQRRAYRRLTAILAALPRRRRDDPLRLATWHLTSGEPLPADALLAGARLAALRHDHELAARLADASAATGSGFAARLLAAESHAWCGRLDEADIALAALQEDAADPAARAAVARARATVLGIGQGRLDEALAVLDHVAGQPLSRPDREVLHGIRIVVDLATGDTTRALASADRVTRPDAEPVIRLHLLPALVTALSWTGRTSEAVHMGTTILGELADAGEHLPYLVETTQTTVVFARAYAGELEAAAAAARAGHRRAQEWQADDLRGVWGYALGYVHLATGHLDQAATLLAETTALLRERLTLFGVRGLANCLGALAEAHACAGRLAAAEWALQACEALPTRGHFLPHLALGRIWTTAARGDLEAARQDALALAEQSTSHGCPTYTALAAHTVVRLGGAPLVTELLAEQARMSQAAIAGFYAQHAAAAANVDGKALDEVAARFAQAGALLLAAEASAHAFSAHCVNGLRRQAQVAAARCRNLAAQCATASTPPLRLIHERTGLTSREREVAALVASGMRNREVAQRLSVSPRTVENHLHRLYAKLGVTGREELAALLRSEHGYT